MIRLHDILDTVSAYNAGADLDLIKKAYVFAAKAHQGQTRRSGDPYLVHPMEVAGILAKMQLDVPSIATALLHDTVEDTVATLEEIEHLFGPEIKDLVDGMTKLSKIQFSSVEQKQAENFRKMLMAMAKDVRVILIKLADRLHNMRTLSVMPEERQFAIAQETLDIYAPIANRLGIQELKVELEDLVLKTIKPDVWANIDSEIKKQQTQMDKYIAEVKNIVARKLKEQEIEAPISGRIKHYYSIWRKMERQKIPFSEVYDIVAFRIIVDNVQQCYEALGAIHALWRPVPGRFRDFIAMPKVNNYQSLHTTVIGPRGQRVEFQIRTKEMQDTAEHGIAAHWKYKEGRLINDKDEMKFKWLRRLLEWQNEISDSTEFLETIKLDLFADDVYVFTPRGDLKELPRGSVPIDLAYSIHTDLGHSTIGAKVNGKIVPLRYQLHSGDSVEILTGKEKRPHKDWLQFVVTSRAKAKIRQFMRQEDNEKSKSIGRDILEKVCTKYNLSITRVLKSKELDEYAGKLSYSGTDTILSAIGYGKIAPLEIVELFVPKEKISEVESHHEDEKKESVIGRLVKKLTRSKGLVKVGGYSDMLVQFGKCCNPVPGDSIVGFVTRGRGVSIHVADCPRVVGMDPDRRVQVSWDMSSGATHIAKLRVVSMDQQGLLSKMTDAITHEGINISGASIHTLEDRTAVNLFELEIKDVEQLRKLIKALERIKGVISVERLRSK